MNLGVDTNIQTAAIHKALGDIKGTKDGTWKIPTFEGLAWHWERKKSKEPERVFGVERSEPRSNGDRCPVLFPPAS